MGMSTPFHHGMILTPGSLAGSTYFKVYTPHGRFLPSSRKINVRHFCRPRLDFVLAFRPSLRMAVLVQSEERYASAVASLLHYLGLAGRLWKPIAYALAFTLLFILRIVTIIRDGLRAKRFEAREREQHGLYEQ